MIPTAHQIATALRFMGFGPNATTKGRARPPWVQHSYIQHAEAKRIRKRRRRLRNAQRTARGLQ